MKRLNSICFFVVFISSILFSVSTFSQLNKEMDINTLYDSTLIYARDSFGINSEEYCTVALNVADYYFDQTDYTKSLNILIELLPSANIVYDNEHLKYLIIKHRLAKTYMFIDPRSSQALKMYMELDKEIYNIVGEKHPEYLTLKVHLALIYQNLSEYNKALQIYLELDKPIKDEYGVESLKYITFQRNYASLKMLMGDNESALEINLKNLYQTKKEVGKKHIKYLISLNHVALNHFNEQDFDKSLKYLLVADKLSKELVGKYHDRRIGIIWNLAEAYRMKSDFSKALPLLKEYQKLQRDRFKIYEHSLNINLRNSLYDELVKIYSIILSISLELNDQDLIREQYSQHCFLKGREMSRINQISSVIQKTNDNELIKIHNDFIAVNKQIAAAIEMDLDKRKKSGLNLNSLQSYSDILEMQLTRLSSAYETSQSAYSFEDIRLELGDNEVYIDIVEMIQPHNSFRLINDPLVGDLDHNYYAYIISKDNLHPQIIKLGSIEDFENAYFNYKDMIGYKKHYFNSWLSNMQEKQGCYNHFWGKFDPYIQDKNKVYFSNEGMYSKINLDVLYDTNTSTFLDDKVEIVYVSSAENFINQSNDSDLSSNSEDSYAVIIGNPTYELNSGQIASVQNSEKSIYDDVFASISRGFQWNQLTGTEIEINKISNKLSSNGWDVELVCCENATESFIKKVNSPKILHLATHGLFSKDREVLKKSGIISDAKLNINNPMINSALVFAGAQNTINNEVLPFDNGLLNSYEASFLNLRGTELVVLSACQTGLGDVQNGRGVYGLQRAIQIAGAESIIMSMWGVSDNATQELMTYFYDFWIDKNISKREAFDAAKTKVREKYPHPFYWGAFIIL
jgi:CHAT domain-containing protein